jgi:hypothetical protein
MIEVFAIEASRETQLVRALREQLNVVIPIATLLVKVLVRVFSREDFPEIARSVANLPLELLLIAMSFMLGALSGISSEYATRFDNQSDADLFAVGAVVGIFFLCLGVNLIMKYAKAIFGKLFVAFAQYRDLSAQPTIPGSVPTIAIAGRLFWALAYCIMMVLMLMSSFAISILSLAYILHLMQ